jgi:hypothetical protein
VIYNLKVICAMEGMDVILNWSNPFVDDLYRNIFLFYRCKYY